MEFEIFNLEKIKDLIGPLEGLQGNLAKLDKLYEDYKEESIIVSNIFENDDFITQLEEVNEILSKSYQEIRQISSQNLNQFLFFQDLLIQKYKEAFKDSLKAINLTQSYTKQLGLYLIENRNISKNIETISFIPSLSLEEWLELLNSLKLNSIFLTGVNNIEKYFISIIESKLELELEKVPDDIDTEIVNKFKETYLRSPISFEEFLYEIEKQLTAEELKKKRKIIEELKKKEVIEDMKKKQEDQFHSSTYQEYIRLSDEEFERRRRKQRREKLSEIAEKPSKEIELSDDVVEKIEKFKSQFEKNFEEEYLIQKDDELDPLDLIRERKKKKKEEYQKYLKKFKKDN
ncbi:MAG: hypothetical protein ACFFBP_02215 [Promethearchaeota archaeon]